MPATSAHRPVRLARPRLSVRGVLGFLADARRALSRARRSSAQLDDHLLRDIGITRADVDAELRRACCC